MEIASRPGQRYVALLERASKAAVPALADGLAIDRGAAAEAFAAAASLVLAGLSRHQRLHPADLRAAGDLVEEYGSPADVSAPELAIGAHLARLDPSPRLGGLLGETAARAVAWLADRTGESPEALARALAASAPLALGALGSSGSPHAVEAWVGELSDAPLSDPARLESDGGAEGEAFRRLRRRGMPWLHRMLAST